MDITARTPAPVGADLAIELLLASPEVEAFGRRTATEVTRARVSAAADAGARGGAVESARARSAPGRWPCWSLMTTPLARWRRTPSQYLPGRAGRLPARLAGAIYGSGLEPAAHLVGERHRALHVLARGGLVAVSADALIERVASAAERPAPIVGRRRRGDRLRRPGCRRSPRRAMSAPTTSRSGASSRCAVG